MTSFVVKHGRALGGGEGRWGGDGVNLRRKPMHGAHAPSGK